jgi:hypothetical protein
MGAPKKAKATAQRRRGLGALASVAGDEGRAQPLLPLRQFAHRVLGHLVISALLTALCLGVGIVGYHYAGGLEWIDALVDASMILSGMGPVSPLRTTAGKVFASGYALFSGIAFLAISGIVVAPVLHRLLHKLHLESGKR